VGVFYREEFENFRELYRRYLAKLKKKKWEKIFLLNEIQFFLFNILQLQDL
jgi:hypothetical protein